MLIQLYLVAVKLYTNSSEIHTKIGETITLKCFAEGNPKPKIIWHKLGQKNSESLLNTWSYLNVIN